MQGTLISLGCLLLAVPIIIIGYEYCERELRHTILNTGVNTIHKQQM